MDLTELLRWRKVIPAVMFCAVIWPLLHVVFVAIGEGVGVSGEGKDVLPIFVSVVALPMGVVYHALNLRGLVMRQTLQDFATKIESEIRKSLEAAGVADTTVIEVGDGRWMRLFYRQIDADSTIGEISKQVRDNGLALSSCADAILIFGAGGLITLIVALLDSEAYVALWASFLLVLGLASLCLFPRLKRNHEGLIDKQILHINAFGKDALFKDYNQMLLGTK